MKLLKEYIVQSGPGHDLRIRLRRASLKVVTSDGPCSESQEGGDFEFGPGGFIIPHVPPIK